MNDDNAEQCQRCGKVGYDRRTLWMACFYAMEELEMPLEQVQITGHLMPQMRSKKLAIFNVTVPIFDEPDRSKPCNNWRFYRLRVCKRCRAEWMTAIADWFTTELDGEAEGEAR